MSWIKLIMVWLSQLLGFWKPPALFKSQAIGIADKAKNDEFLAVSKRADWTDDDCQSAKLFVTGFLISYDISELANLPAHYFCLVDDELLLASKNRLDAISQKVTSEIAKRASR